MNIQLLSYGNYSNDQLENLCNECRFCVLINGTESQGIAVQEIMSTNTSLFVWDVVEWTDEGEEYKLVLDNNAKAHILRASFHNANENFYELEDEGEIDDRFDTQDQFLSAVEAALKLV